MYILVLISMPSILTFHHLPGEGCLQLLVLSVTVISLSAKSQYRYQFIEEWKLWKTEHSKYYESEREEIERHTVWLSNREYIYQHNVNHKAGVLGYKLALNKFADMVNK